MTVLSNQQVGQQILQDQNMTFNNLDASGGMLNVSNTGQSIPGSAVPSQTVQCAKYADNGQKETSSNVSQSNGDLENIFLPKN